MLALHLVSGYHHESIPTPDQKLHPVTLLVTFAPTDADFKAHPLPLITAAAAALGIPHKLYCIAAPFLDSYRQQLQQLNREHHITHLVTGDILDVAGGFMEAAVQGTSVQLVRPLWQCPRHDVLTALCDLRIHSKISCVDMTKYSMSETSSTHQQGPQPDDLLCQQVPAVAQHASQHDSRSAKKQLQQRVSPTGGRENRLSHFSQSFDAEQLLLGHELTAALVSGPLAAAEQLFGADLGGEHGEYHTIVFDAPLMETSLRLEVVEHITMQTGSSQLMYVAWNANATASPCGTL